jgi:hypothetical protein
MKAQEAEDETVGIVASINKGGRSLDLNIGGNIPLTRVRLEASMLAEQHQAVVRRLVLLWNADRSTPLAELERRFGEAP